MTLTLPTEPYAVIRVTAAAPPTLATVWVRGQRYWSPLGETSCFTQEEAEKCFNAWTVLAIPAAQDARAANAERELVDMLDSLDDSVSHEQIYAAMRQLLDVVRGDREEVSLA